MALQTIPGFTGFQYARIASMDKRAIGKLTDSNHLESFHDLYPSNYDKKIISLYTQSSLYSNDFLDMVNKSTPFYLDGLSDTWQWDIEVPFKFAKIVEVPQATLDLDKIGIDGQEFTIVFDTEFAATTVVSVGHLIYGPQLYVTKDPTPYLRGWLHTVTYRTPNPQVEFVDRKFLQQGIDVQAIDNVVGEFDQQLSGLDRLGERIKMYETLGSGYGFEHKVTAWADDKMLKDEQGNAKDILMFMDMRRNELPITKNSIKWEPFVEFLMRKAMLERKVKRMIWNKPGTTKSNGSKQELKKSSAGVFYRMRNSGNYVPYNRGEFTGNLIRSVFGDLFYRRVDVKDRKVKLFTNEAGFDVFQQAVKDDAVNSGLTLMATGGANGLGVQGTGQNLTYNWAFDSMVTRETGRVELSHLKELDLPQTNLQFGQNKKSTPIFMVFNVSPNSDGSLVNNIREVRRAGVPNMTWGYIDGRRSHLGAFKSQGHSAANKFNGYEIFMEDRCDAFIEDMSRTVLIEEIPQF